jgi:two-component system, NarL family, invasion response regulator UvrY
MRQAHKLSILIVDEHLLVRLGLKQVLRHEYGDIVYGEAGTAKEALAQIKARPWRLVILGVSLPDNDGFFVLREICAHRPETAVLMLSMHADSQHAARSLQLGAAGYISKISAKSDLLKAVGSVLAGKKHFSESSRHGVDPSALHENLSDQEWKVLLALAAGTPIGGIAAELTLSVKTVSTYKRRALNKLGLKTTADLVRYVIDHKLSYETCNDDWPLPAQRSPLAVSARRAAVMLQSSAAPVGGFLKSPLNKQLESG